MPPRNFYSIRKFLILVSNDVLNYFCHIPFFQVLLHFSNLPLSISFYILSRVLYVSVLFSIIYFCS